MYLDNVGVAQSGKYGHFLSDLTQLRVLHPTLLYHPALPDKLHYHLWGKRKRRLRSRKGRKQTRTEYEQKTKQARKLRRSSSPSSSNLLFIETSWGKPDDTKASLPDGPQWLVVFLKLSFTCASLLQAHGGAQTLTMLWFTDHLNLKNKGEK